MKKHGGVISIFIMNQELINTEGEENKKDRIVNQYNHSLKISDGQTKNHYLQNDLLMDYKCLFPRK